MMISLCRSSNAGTLGALRLSYPFCRHPLGAGLATGATLGLIAKGETSVFSGRLDIIIRKFRLFSVWLGILVWRCAIRRRAPGGFSVRLDYAKNSTSRTV